MNTSVQFRNFDGFDHIKNFVENSVDIALGKFEAWRDFETHVVLRTVKARTLTHAPVFECELVMIGKGLLRPVVVKKKNSDFYLALRDCIKASEKILRRASKARVSKRRHIGVQINNSIELAA